MKQRPRRTETPVTTHVAVLQGLRWGLSSAQELVVAIRRRTRGRVNIHTGLVYKTLSHLVDQALVRRLERVDGEAARYRLTTRGRRHAERERAALSRLFA
jgi:DNA-binding PadR family transcriptional regulator